MSPNPFLLNYFATSLALDGEWSPTPLTDLHHHGWVAVDRDRPPTQQLELDWVSKVRHPSLRGVVGRVHRVGADPGYVSDALQKRGREGGVYGGGGLLVWIRSTWVTAWPEIHQNDGSIQTLFLPLPPSPSTCPAPPAPRPSAAPSGAGRISPCTPRTACPGAP